MATTRDCEDLLTRVDRLRMVACGEPQPGTTFPPVRCSMQQFDEMVRARAEDRQRHSAKAKCHSESDLVSAWVLRNRHYESGSQFNRKQLWISFAYIGISPLSFDY